MTEKITDGLDLAGMLLLVAAASVAAWMYVAPWAGLLAAGVGCLLVSVSIDVLVRRAARRLAATVRGEA